MEDNDSKIIHLNNEDKSKEVEEGNSALLKPIFGYDTSLLPISYTNKEITTLNSKVINKRFYNNFNFSKLALSASPKTVILGITSPNKGEGKTLVASNMAVSLAKAYHQRTVIVDLNIKNPELHKIFGVNMSPGLAEGLQNKMLRVRQTNIKNLYLLTSGDVFDYPPGIKDTIALREVLYTLKKEFDFIIVDMNSIFPIEEFPIHFINEIEGLLTVIDASSTKREELERIYNHIDERRFMGYVFNRYDSKG